jgi:DNA-binding transcriptional LysR family regulator
MSVAPPAGPVLNDIALFVEVGRLLNFSKAADALGLSTSSVSRRIARLEATIGTALFHRSSRRVVLTQAGEAYLERCARIIEDAASAHEQLGNSAGALRGCIRMSIPVDFGLVFIAPTLTAFARAHPDITFEVDMSPRRVDLVREKFDLVIRVGDLEDSTSLVVRRLVYVQLGLYAAPSYVGRAGSPQSPAALTDHECLSMLLPERQQRWNLQAGTEEVVAVPRGRMAINNLSMLRAMLLDGHGIGALDAVLVDRDVAEGRLVRVLPNWSMPAIPISVITPGKRIPTRVREWIAFVAERLRCFDCGPPDQADRPPVKSSITPPDDL